ncbi:glutamate synthase subunit beta [Caminibacter mediatlanticus]|uniref:Glutamate synthase, NADH/NADPH, small subunit 2 n=1 Tax=Caminibacter mediatlanticus TB-2 TaxID=391592 RepID=A0AAI9AIV1_9BACT|nr:glutamate synthase subunit beta [Caminibacter mediatlanticus]EDM24279.1 Glutamate synthase, NADH/NADPH, small subunit 2 [Caminibacter mediatlanticus TB-2]
MPRRHFHKIPRKIQRKRPAEERVKDFHPVYHEFEDKEALDQALRCITCPIDLLRDFPNKDFPFCRTGCPLTNKIPQWIKALKHGDLKTAFELSNETSPFPEIMGRICPHDNLCQGSCTIHKTPHGSVTIGALEVYISEKGFEEGFKPYYGEDKEKKGKVAVIGAGPAGLSCATFLLREGVNVDIYDKHDRPGGLLMYGIPNFKLPKDRILRRVKWMEEAGAKFILNHPVLTEKEFEEIVDNYDAVFIGVGAPSGRGAGIPNEEAKGVYHVMDVLIHAQKRVFKDFDDCFLRGKKVVVLGGGDSAMDAVRTSVRSGAKEVYCVYRRDEANMPGSKKEVENAKEEGVKFIFYAAPKEIKVNENNEVVGIVCNKTELTEPDERGRRRVRVVEGSEFEIDCDIIIFALGFDNVKFPWYEHAGIETDKWGCPVVNDKFQTTNEKVFAGGDAIRGADLVVTAVRDGREAAKAIAKMIRG